MPVDTLRSGVIGSLTDLKNKYKPTTDMADGYRFQVSDLQTAFMNHAPRLEASTFASRSGAAQSLQ